jgi:uncharacterized RDD family membrane protein YckC
MVIAWLGVPARGQTSDAAAMRNLLAHGTEQQLWCADVVGPRPGLPGAGLNSGPNAPAARTVIRFRTSGQSQWTVIAEIAAPAVALDNRGSELLVVLASGQWRIVSSDGDVRSGIDLPGQARILAIAGGDEGDVWAIGAAAAGRMLAEPAHPVATAPSNSSSTSAVSTAPAIDRPAATTEASPSTAPATSNHRPHFPPHEVGLFHLVQGTWSEIAPLPGQLKREDLASASLDVIEHRVMLALASRQAGIRIFTHTTAGWSDGRDIAAFNDNDRMKLTDFEGRPLLWVSQAQAPGEIYLGDGGAKWSNAIKLAPPANQKEFDRTALVVALGRLRLLESDGKGRLAEQNYNLDGTLSGAATEAVTAPVPIDTRIAEAMQLLVMAVLVIWIVGAMRQRPAMQEAVKRIDRAALAPLGRRLVGGIIDALPVLIGFAIAGEIAQHATQPLSMRLTLNSPEVAISALGLGLYLLHTTICELIFSRTLGKVITGTRVVQMSDGKPPLAASILVRNLLRIIDVFMIFPPIFVVFSPLRQRVGDMAAGTIVIRNASTPIEQAEP